MALLFVVGEEMTHDGAHAANAHHTTSRILIDGEPTEGKLALGTKGAMRVVLRTRAWPRTPRIPSSDARRSRRW